MKTINDNLDLLYNTLIDVTENRISYSSRLLTQIQKTENLSKDGLQSTHLLKNINHNTTRVLHLLKNILFKESYKKELTFVGIADFLTNLSDATNTLIAGYLGTEIVLSRKPRKNRIIYTNPNVLEYIFGYITSLLMKNFSDEGKRTVKITTAEDEIEKILTISISAEGHPLPSYILNQDEKSTLYKFHDITEMSIWSIGETLKALGGNIIYKRTRLFNKFIITLPLNLPDEAFTSVAAAHETKVFVPDLNLIDALFFEFSDLTKF